MTSSAQLDADIAAALARGTGNADSLTLTAKRAKTFRDDGLYDVLDGAGALVTKMFRDPHNREWYEENMPGRPQTHYVERWLGSTQAEALDRITKRRNR